MTSRATSISLSHDPFFLQQCFKVMNSQLSEREAARDNEESSYSNIWVFTKNRQREITVKLFAL